jgi:rhamnose transport system ATP-binding protein
MTPLLVFKRISKSFGAVHALRGVDFELRPGEVHALLGENGAGKSTLIRIATGAHAPDGGTVWVDGEALEAFTPALAHDLGIACIYQQPALFPDLTVMENLALRLEKPSSFRRVRWAERRKRAMELLARVGAEISPDATVNELSMPEQQLVEIAGAVGAEARIVIMDEPTASLTRREQERLYAIVRTLKTEGIGIIYISHRLEEIFALADRVTVLRDGASTGTFEVREIDEGALIRLMVGREVTHLYPPSLGAPGEVRLRVDRLCCQASGVKDISFEVRAGEILGLAGLVGAGRSELARVLFGLTPADGGTLSIDGQAIRVRSPSDAIAQGIAYVPEDRRRHGVVPDMTVAENVTLAAHRRYFPSGWLQERIEASAARDAVERLAIKTAGIDAPVSSLSGGNQQKVSLSRWLATEPKLLVLDEPTQGVDVGAKSEIHALVRRFAAAGMAVILISSDLPEILGMSDRIGVMRGGKLVGILPAGSAAADVMAVALGQNETSGKDAA